MKTFRKVIFWTHLTAGLLGGIVIFIMSVTGAALSFEKNIIEYFESDQRYVTVPENGQKLGPQEVLAKVREARPEAKPSAISILNRPDSAYTVALGREGQVFVNPYTGAITGEGSPRRAELFQGRNRSPPVYRALRRRPPHRQGDHGRVQSDVPAAGGFGIYIWFPRQLVWRQVKPVMWFRRGIGGKARDFNWHNTIGFWTSLILIVLTLTASVISYQWAGNLLYTLTGNEVPAPQQAAPGRGAAG